MHARAGHMQPAHRLVQAWRERRDAARVASSQLLLQRRALRRIFMCWHVLVLRFGARAQVMAARHASSMLLVRSLKVSTCFAACACMSADI